MYIFCKNPESFSSSTNGTRKKCLAHPEYGLMRQFYLLDLTLGFIIDARA